MGTITTTTSSSVSVSKVGLPYAEAMLGAQTLSLGNDLLTVAGPTSDSLSRARLEYAGFSMASVVNGALAWSGLSGSALSSSGMRNDLLER